MQDPPARRYWPLPVWFDRDRCRGPMPWTGGRNGGFTTGRPWSRMAADYATRNVARQSADPDLDPGLLPAPRRAPPSVRGPVGRSLRLARPRATDDVLAWLRTAGEQRMLVALTTASAERTVELGRAPGPSRGRLLEPWAGRGATASRAIGSICDRSRPSSSPSSERRPTVGGSHSYAHTMRRVSTSPRSTPTQPGSPSPSRLTSPGASPPPPTRSREQRPRTAEDRRSGTPLPASRAPSPTAAPATSPATTTTATRRTSG